MNQYIGQLLDNRYEILEVIGTGGMAVVYKALCHRLNRMVAVKILKDEFSGDEEFRKRFRAEGEAVAMLSHPNIVQVFDVSSADNVYYIVMELIDGISLKQYMEVKQTLNWKETLHFATQIAKGLEHAHSRGIVHRDIKPHNVMVLKNGSVKVMDFGIAQVMNKRSTLTKEALGSVHYISPEQARGSTTDNRSDIYSLGVVMYEMMTGRPPYDGDNPVAVAIQHINGGAIMPTKLNPNIPAGMEQIIMKAMALEPRDRFDTAGELLQDLEEFRKNPSITFQYHFTVDEATRKLGPITLRPQTQAQKIADKNGGMMTNNSRQKSNVTAQELAEKERRNQEAQLRARQRRREEERRQAERSKAAAIAVVSCSLVAVIAIVVFLVAIFNGTLVNLERDLVEVPYLLGDMYTEDFERKYSDFKIRLQPQEYDDFYVMGQIKYQEPDGGSKVKKGADLFITISMGEEPKVKLMEDLVNVTQDRAVSFLIGQGLKTLVREEASSEFAVGHVIRTEPEADAQLYDGQTVKLWISTGPETVTERVPEVLGMTRDMAVKVLEQLKFRNVTLVNVFSDKEKGTVVSQSEGANTVIEVSRHIILEISNGPENPTVQMPSVLTKDLAAAEYLLHAMGFTNVRAYGVDSTMPQGQVVTQSEDVDAVIPLDKEIVLGVSNGPVTEPTEVTTEPTQSVTEETQPMASVTKKVTFSVPVREESYYLVLTLSGQISQRAAADTIEGGQSTFTVELSGVGEQSYDLYINGNYYQTQKVSFVNHD